MITEEQKQEADMVVEKYIPYSHGHNDATSYHYATHCAIQDRQSVLKFADNVKELLTDSDGHPRVNCIYFDKVKLEITNLTAQIEYLNFCEIESLQSKILKDISDKQEIWAMEIIRKFAMPKIRGEITAKKIKQRGIILNNCHGLVNSTYWITQKGKEIGERFVITSKLHW